MQLAGVRLRDVLKLADVNLENIPSVIVRGKPLIYSVNTEPIELLTIYFEGKLRGKRGERVIEVASDIKVLGKREIGTLRLGIS